MKRRMIFALLLAVLGLLMLPTAAAFAQDDLPGEPPVTEDDVNEIASDLYCPVCENVPLDVCGTQACADWRAEIRTMLEDGSSEEDIRGYFADRYGRRVLATPDASGIDLLLWLVPPFGVIIGAVVLFFTLRRIAPEVASETLAPQAALNYEGLDPAYVARIEGELQEMRESL